MALPSGKHEGHNCWSPRALLLLQPLPALGGFLAGVLFSAWNGRHLHPMLMASEVTDLSCLSSDISGAFSGSFVPSILKTSTDLPPGLPL